jgi:hypothetical protein
MLLTCIWRAISLVTNGFHGLSQSIKTNAGIVSQIRLYASFYILSNSLFTNNYMVKKVKLSLQQALKAHRVVRC